MQCTVGILTLEGISEAVAGFNARMYRGGHHAHPIRRAWRPADSAAEEGAAGHHVVSVLLGVGALTTRLRLP
jgi:hypothetical protein